jgi:enediyne biosynthesis protein E4
LYIYTFPLFKKSISLSNIKSFLSIQFFTTFLFLFISISCSQHEIIELEWHEGDGYRWADLPIKSIGSAGFEKLEPSYTGITIHNSVPVDEIDQNRILLNGSGVAAGDINGNGLPDLYFTNLFGDNKLYENLGGFRFRDITDETGVAHTGHLSTGTVFADVNGNGHLDLLITTLESENSLYLNDGTGNFTLKENSGLGKSNGAMTMALADINNNGYPDLYIVNYKKRTVRDLYPFTELSTENIIENHTLVPPFDEYFTLLDRGDLPPDPREVAEADEFYFNNGDGTFSKVTSPESMFLNEDGEPEGLQKDWGLAARFQDLNGNGLPDLYVANDFWTPDRIWINRGNGTFQAIDTLAIRNSSYSSMAVDFSDINRNGYTDMFVVEMLSTRHHKRLIQMDSVYPYPLWPGEYRNRPMYNRNSLFLNRGDHTYSEISYYSGLQASEWSWATRFIDVTLNGYEDLIVNTGFRLDLQNLDSQMSYVSRAIQTQDQSEQSILVFPELRQQNKAFQNNGDLTFSDVSSDWGFTDRDISLGMAVADLNNDGYLDLVISRMDDPGIIFRNKSNSPRIAIRLKGKSPNTQALGAKIELLNGPVPSQAKQLFAGGDYLSGSDQLVMFAANSQSDHDLIIYWPDGTMSRLDGLKANRIYEIDQNSIHTTEKSIDSIQPGLTPIFSDRSDLLINHQHSDNDLNDFEIQPLLPFSLSNLGPGLGWIDLTGDGTDELLIGTGQGGKSDVFSFHNESSGITDIPVITDQLSEGQSGIVAWNDGSRTHLVIGNFHYEQNSDQEPSAIHYILENGEVIDQRYLPGMLSASGPLTAGDYTGNGEIDLFIGGRFEPGNYPADTRSRLFKNIDGELIPDTENEELFYNSELITGAVFVDINRNGQQDLITTSEWGSVNIYINEEGTFTDKTIEFGLDQYLGLWQGITSGDFTGNGFPDLVVTNWGTNSPYQIENREFPLKIFYHDFNQNQQTEIIETYYDFEIQGYVPRRKFLDYTPLHENLLLHVGSHMQYSGFTIEDMTHMNIDDIPHKSANTLEHMIFINHDGERFDVIPLPAKAQFSSGFYAGVADMDNNGHEDIFISQNFFQVSNPQSNPRLDSGRGLWLKGDGNGNFEAVPSHLSGVQVYGEQRGAALGDFNQNGRTDLAISQNSAGTRLFVNNTDNRGYRITLSGPEGNKSGIGSGIRMVYEDYKGPVRTIHAGSGYWSQNSFTQVLGASSAPQGIEVIWFDGTTQIVNIEDGIMDYMISYPE